jgi:hypothetical protein
MKVTTKFLEDNPDFLKQFEEDQRKIDALESYDYIQWLEKSPSSAIENYNQWLVFKNRKPRKFKRLIGGIKKFCRSNVHSIINSVVIFWFIFGMLSLITNDIHFIVFIPAFVSACYIIWDSDNE